jgi:nucleotide-binding universal stress UspA family protein
MAIKTILSICSPARWADDVKAAAQVCFEAEAHLSVLLAGVAQPPPTGEYAAELALEWQELMHSDGQRLAAAAGQATEVLSRIGPSFDVSITYEPRASLADAIGLRARYADLVLTSRTMLATEDAVTPIVEGSLFQSARPLLIVPADGVPPLRPKRVMIAWDSRLESARAVYGALDLLAHAQEVRVVMVDPVASDGRNGAEPGADIAAYLARHGLAVTVERLPSGGLSVADVLKRHATDMAADLLVMGAYGHSRLRERIFGGMTRAFIDGADLPVLMAH